MPVLKNARHERFAQALASGKTLVDAHEQAGFKPNDGNASKLGAHPEVQARVKEITGRVASKVEITLESLIVEADAIQKAASADKQHSAATAALTAKAKLAGLWIERGEHSNTNVNYTVSDEPQTESDWHEQHVTEH